MKSKGYKRWSILNIIIILLALFLCLMWNTNGFRRVMSLETAQRRMLRDGDVVFEYKPTTEESYYKDLTWYITKHGEEYDFYGIDTQRLGSFEHSKMLFKNGISLVTLSSDTYSSETDEQTVLIAVVAPDERIATVKATFHLQGESAPLFPVTVTTESMGNGTYMGRFKFKSSLGSPVDINSYMGPDGINIFSGIHTAYFTHFYSVTAYDANGDIVSHAPYMLEEGGLADEN